MLHFKTPDFLLVELVYQLFLNMSDHLHESYFVRKQTGSKDKIFEKEKHLTDCYDGVLLIP